LGACGADERDEAAIKAAIQETLKKKIANFKKVRRQRCLNDIYDEANIIVDSILLEEARQKRDTIGKPARPIKPEKPEIKTILDTLPIAPLLEKDSLE
jgi:hypothetical protein